jgi:hypothetical protein
VPEIENHARRDVALLETLEDAVDRGEGLEQARSKQGARSTEGGCPMDATE